MFNNVKYRLKASLKSVRPASFKQNLQKKRALKKFCQMLATIVVLHKGTEAKKCRFWLQDEGRLGLKAAEQRRLTCRGVRPVKKRQWQFQADWLYGLAEPS